MSVPLIVALCIFVLTPPALPLSASEWLECEVKGNEDPEGKEGCRLDVVENLLDSLSSRRLTRDLAILPISKEGRGVQEEKGRDTLDRVDQFLTRHELNLRLPQELMSFAVDLGLPRFISLPLASPSGRSYSGRGILRKVILPFLLGLKFKATAVVPLMMAMIALKTWKALTLGLLSLVLSAAMVIFRLTRPKTVNYEVYYPPHHSHLVADHYDHPHKRSIGADIAYSAHAPSTP